MKKSPVARITTALGPVLLLAVLAACSETGDQPAGAQGGPPPTPAPVTLASRPDAAEGEKLYVEYCIMCHGDNGMGTGLLARRSDVPLLEKRTDLTADFVIQAARMGIGNMPAIPRGEVSDERLQLIADYLSANAETAQ